MTLRILYSFNKVQCMLRMQMEQVEGMGASSQSWMLRWGPTPYINIGKRWFFSFFRSYQKYPLNQLRTVSFSKNIVLVLAQVVTLDQVVTWAYVYVCLTLTLSNNCMLLLFEILVTNYDNQLELSNRFKLSSELVIFLTWRFIRT